jgi:hypothetical protein
LSPFSFGAYRNQELKFGTWIALIETEVSEMITIKKIQKSSRSYGRGMDSTYSPARYGIFQDGKQVGLIAVARPLRYMERPLWEVILTHDGTYMYAVVKIANSFKLAKQKALDYFNKLEVKS